MSLRLLTPLLLLLVALGFAVGLRVDRLLEDSASTPPERPAPLERAWRALESKDAARLRAAAAALDPAAMPSAAFRDEVTLLQAAALGDRTAVRGLAETGVGRPLGAQALTWLIETAADATERGALLALLAERYPDAWRVPNARDTHRRAPTANTGGGG